MLISGTQSLVVHVHNRLSHEMVKHRELGEQQVIFLFGIDGGGGFLKFCLAIIPLMDITNESVPKRLKLSDCEIVGTIFQDSGMKKIFTLAIAADVQENYKNV